VFVVPREVGIIEMTGKKGRVSWIVFLIVAVLAGSIVLVLLGARRPKFEISPEGLRVRGSLYGRFIPASQLRLDAARVVDLGGTPELRPKWRTNGVGLPGYSAGWFRLFNREKALVFLTQRDRVLYVPTTAGYSILISPDDPDAFLRELRATLRRA
jgi:hypothetical protein